MAFSRAKFLIEMLGPDGARALAKAADRSELLAQAIVPRTIVAWLRSTDSFSGEIPGAPGQLASFSKSEDGFSGRVAVQGRDYEFRGVSLFLAAAAIAVSVGIDSAQVPQALKNIDLERLGKSIDLMVRAQRLQKEESAEVSTAEESSAGDAHGEYSRQEIYQDKEPLKKKAKEGGTGQPASPVAPAAPQAPTASAPMIPTTQKLPKKPASAGSKPANAYRLTRSEVAHLCPICARSQFDGGSFVGCSCFRALAKSVAVVERTDDYVDIQLGEGWDRETVLTLLESVGRK